MEKAFITRFVPDIPKAQETFITVGEHSNDGCPWVWYYYPLWGKCIHIGVGVLVARSDCNGQFLRPWSVERVTGTGSTSEPELHFVDIDCQYVTDGCLMY